MGEGTTDEIYVLGINGETTPIGGQAEAVFDINGTAKFFNILSGGETIGRFIPGAPVDLYLSNTTLNGTYEVRRFRRIHRILRTGNSIRLKPGFTAPSGIDFTAEIGTVTNVAKRFYYLKDHLGSIRVVARLYLWYKYRRGLGPTKSGRINEAGDIVSSDDYDPWGMILNGRSTDGSYLNAKYKFTGKERDVETGYDYFACPPKSEGRRRGARYYDSRIGRWLQVDPLFEKYPGVSPYAYSLNNPISNFDPNGKYTKSFIYNNYYFHRFTITEAWVHTMGQAFIPLPGQIIADVFPSDPSFNRSSWTLADNPFTRHGLAKVFNSKGWEYFNKGMGLFEASNTWSEIRSNFVYDEAAFNYALSLSYKGESAVLQGNIIGFNDDGSPKFVESSEGTTLGLNPKFVEKKFGGDLEKSQQWLDEQMQFEKTMRGITGGAQGWEDYKRFINELK